MESQKCEWRFSSSLPTCLIVNGGPLTRSLILLRVPRTAPFPSNHQSVVRRRQTAISSLTVTALGFTGRRLDYSWCCTSLFEHNMSTQLNPTQLNPTEFNPTQHDPTQFNPTQHDPT